MMDIELKFERVLEMNGYFLVRNVNFLIINDERFFHHTEAFITTS